MRARGWDVGPSLEQLCWLIRSSMPCWAEWYAKSPLQVRAVRRTQLLYARSAVQNSSSGPEFEVEAQNSELHLRILHCRLTVRREKDMV